MKKEGRGLRPSFYFTPKDSGLKTQPGTQDDTSQPLEVSGAVCCCTWNPKSMFSARTLPKPNFTPTAGAA